MNRIYFSISKLIIRNQPSLGLLIFPLLVLIPYIDTFPYPSYPFVVKSFSDFVITHYPNALLLQRTLKEWHTLPLWNPTIFSGYPFFADPLSGLWYPFGWLALLLPLPMGLNLCVLLHLLWLGLGMYAWLRIEGMDFKVALWGAIAVESLPKLYAHYGAGHLTLLYAIAWTPWLLYLAKQNVCHLLNYEIRIPSGVVLAMIFLADVRWVAYAGFLWILYLIWHRRMSLSILFDIILGVLLSGPLLVPFIEYVFLSSRTMLTPEETLSLSLPQVGLLGMVFPTIKGYYEWVWYTGGIPFFLSICASITKPFPQKRAFWMFILTLSVLYSLGSHFPLANYFSRLPIFGLLRVPARALFIADFSLIVLASFGLNDFLSGDQDKNAPRLKMALIGLILFILALALGMSVLYSSLPYKYFWSIGVIFPATLLTVMLLRKSVTIKVWFAFIITVSILETSILNCFSFTPINKNSVLSERFGVVRFLKNLPGKWRVYSPSYSIPQQMAAFYGLELADGVNPLQISHYVHFMEMASGVPYRAYSVTIPPFENGDPSTANVLYKPNANLLGLLNVAYVVVDYPLEVEGLKLIAEFGNTKVYENMLVNPRVWIQVGDEFDEERTRFIEAISWEPNRIHLKGRGPGLLVLSVINYPGWQVIVDGQRGQLNTVSEVLMGVNLSEGLHTIEFIFRPLSLKIGLLFCVFGVIALILLILNEHGRLHH